MRIACVQSNVAFNDPAANAAHLAEKLQTLQGVDLAIFPEAFLTGYCVDCAADAGGIAIPRDHSAIETVRQASEEFGILLVVGFAEREGDAIFNSAALFEPGRPVRFYRKTHLPHLGLDRFVDPGQELPIFETKLGKLGILICFDLRPPEPSRVLALEGAELIVLPTNWPEGAETSAEHVAITRAAENRVFVATCNRVGEENGFRFIGRSKIIDPAGKVIAAAGTDEEVIVADVDLSEARVKRNVNIPGKYETAVFDCRNPALYERIARR